MKLSDENLAGLKQIAETLFNGNRKVVSDKDEEIGSDYEDRHADINKPNKKVSEKLHRGKIGTK